MGFWFTSEAPPSEDWPLRCILPLLNAATRSSEQVFMWCYTADDTGSIRIMDRLLAGIRAPKLPDNALMTYFCFLAQVVIQIPNSPALRNVVAGLLEKIIMVTYSSVSRRLCEEFDESILPVVRSAVESVL